MTRPRLPLILLGGAAAAALLPAPAAQAQSAESAISTLIRQAAFWRERGRPDLARQSLERVLQTDPNNTEALAALARYAGEDGDAAAAQRWTARLRAAAPNDPRLATLQGAAQARQAAATAIPEARRLAQRGDTAGAIAAYRRAFGGSTPPAAYAREYYETLAGSPADRSQAVTGLRELVRQSPGDTGLRLALARTLTYSEATRREGVNELARLARGSDAAAAPAAQAWRQALIWLSANPADIPLYEAYLTTRGEDAEVRQKLAQARDNAQRAQASRTPTDTLAPLRSQGFAALERGDVATAQARFEAVLAQRPSDADALGGLGLVRLRAEQFAEAEQLLDRASRAAPGAQSRWREALASARFFSGLRQAQAALAAGDTARARSLAEGLRAPAAEDQALAQMVMAESLRRERRWADAETAYRAVLQSSPGSEDARLGLLEALIGRNTPESQAQAQQLAADLNRQGVGGARLGQVLAQAELARATALADQGDLAGAAAAFQSALASQPANAWIRYDYARFLDAQGQGLAADGLMAGARQLGDPENLYALALYLDQKGRLTEAQGLLAQIPPAALTAPMAEFARELEQRAAISQLAALAASGEAYQAIPTLRAYAGQPDLPLGLRGQIALALYDAGDQGQALALAQAALLAAPGSEPAAYAGFVKVLARAGRDIEAAGLIRRISTEAAATPAARRELASLGAALGVERAERLRQGGDLAGAFDALSQAYSLAPQDADILKALGRLYMAGDLHANAQGVYQGLLALRPNDPDALAGLAEAALAQNDPQTARRSIRQAIAQAPENVDLLLLAARVEQSAGDRAAARRALEEARRLRERQMAAAGRGMGLPGAPGGLGPNPFLRQLAPSAWAAPGLAALPQATPAPERLALGGARPWAASLAAADLPLPGRAAASAAIPAASPWSVAQTTPSVTSPYGPPSAPAWPVAPAAPVTPAPAAAFNPFALPSAPAPSAAPQGFYAPGYAAPQARPTSGDPVLSAIDRQIAELSRRAAPEIRGEVNVRVRSGEAGLSQLSSLQGRASISTPVIGSGRLALVVEPVTLDGGSANADGRLRYGANPIPAGSALAAEGEPQLVDIGAQTASGVGVSVTYTSGAAALDLGTSPMGFRKVEPLGGVRWTPTIAPGVEGRIWAERRAVSDSITSYAGSKDPVTGLTWGQVTRTGGGLGVVVDQPGTGAYAEVSAYRFEGDQTADNQAYQVNLGAYVRPYRTEERELQIGVNLNHQAYDNNQNRFTLGHGGYFSPQAFTSLAMPITFRHRSPAWNLEVGVTPGYETYREDAVAVFPNRPDLQGQLEFLAGESERVSAFYPSRSRSGFGVSAGGKLEYDLNGSAQLGVEARYSGFGDYDETRGAIYLRQTLGAGGRP